MTVATASGSRDSRAWSDSRDWSDVTVVGIEIIVTEKSGVTRDSGRNST